MPRMQNMRNGYAQGFDAICEKQHASLIQLDE